MKLSDIGERAIISNIIKGEYFNNLNLDDCAVINFNGFSIVVSVDQLFKEPFVMRIGGTLKDLGKLFVTQNTSDIAAMGCSPIGFLFGISMPASLELSDFELLLSGIKEELSHYNIPLLGGDTKESDKIYLSGTILGINSQKDILRRKGAHIGDIICLSKPVGKSFSNYIDYANKRTSQILSPKADIGLGEILAKSNLCTSCIDTSDGVFASLQIMAGENNLTFNVDLDKVSYVFPEDSQGDTEWINYILNIGGDFGLLFTLKSGLKSELFINEHNIQQIGYVSNSNQKIILSGDYAKSSSILPWEHFSNLESFKINFDKFINNDVHNLQ